MSKASDASPAPGQPHRGKRRRRDPHVSVTHDMTEAIGCRFPRLPGIDDLLVRAADEVPPHDDVVLEGLTAQKEQRRIRLGT